MSKVRICTAVLFASAGLVSADTVKWDFGTSHTSTANLSWGTATSWNTDSLPDSDDVAEFDNGIFTTLGERVITLDGDRTIGSLTGKGSTATQATRSYAFAPGTGGILTIATGNITLDGGGVNGARPISLANITTQIGVPNADPEAPPTLATWNFTNSGTNSSYLIGSIKGESDTVITLVGNNGSVWSGNSSEYYGKIILQQSVKTANAGGIKLELNASNALGGVGSMVVSAGTGEFTTYSHLHFNSVSTVTATTHSMSIQVDTKLGLAVGIGGNLANPGFVSKATIQGNLSGAAAIDVGTLYNSSTAYPYGLLILEGENNTHTGGVNIKTGGRLQVDGNWVDAGNFVITRGVLSGSGNIGMAASKTVSLAADGTTAPATLTAGAEGAVGTLTIGTLDNANTVTINSAATGRTNQLLIDLDGDETDRIFINGNLTIGATNTYLVFNEINPLVGGTYVLASWTGTLTGAFANVTNKPAYANLEYDIDGKQLLLVVPEPSTLGLLTIAGFGMLARRRSRGKLA